MLISVAAFGQIYSVRAYEPGALVETEEKMAAEPLLHPEIYIGPAASWQPIHDKEHNEAGAFWYGAAAGIRLHMANWALGAEGQIFAKTTAGIPYLDYVKQRGWYITFLWDITPQVFPLLQVEGGWGQFTGVYKLKLTHASQYRLVSPAAFLGIRLTVPLGHGWNLAPSVRCFYQSKRNFAFLLHYANHQALQASLAVTKSF